MIYPHQIWDFERRIQCYQTSKARCFVNIVNGRKHSILDVWLGSKSVSGTYSTEFPDMDQNPNFPLHLVFGF